MDKELLNYISRGRGAGILDEEIRDALLGVGWTVEEVNEALNEAGSHLPIINAVPTKEELSLEWTKTHKSVFWVLVVSIILIIVGLLGAIIYKTYQESRSFDKLTTDVLKAVSQVESFNYDGEFSLELKQEISVAGNSTSSVPLPDIAIDQTSTTSSSFQGSFSHLDQSRPKFEWFGKTTVESSDKDTFYSDLEARLIDNTLYLFISQITKWQFLDLESLVGRWLSVTPVDMAKLGLDINITAPSVNQFLAWRGAVANSQAFNLVDKIGVEEINSVELVRYSFSFDLGSSRYLFDEINNLAINHYLSKEVQVLVNQGLVFGEVWVGKKDDLIYKVVVESTFSDDAEKEDGYVALELNFSDFNTEINIERPDNPQSLFNLFDQLLNASSSVATSTED